VRNKVSAMPRRDVRESHAARATRSGLDQQDLVAEAERLVPQPGVDDRAILGRVAQISSLAERSPVSVNVTRGSEAPWIIAGLSWRWAIYVRVPISTQTKCGDIWAGGPEPTCLI